MNVYDLCTYVSKKSYPLIWGGDLTVAENQANFINNQINGYYAKDQVIDGITLVDNTYIVNKESFIKTYDAWENSNGIGLLGKTVMNPDNLSIYKDNDITVYNILSSTPIFINDILIVGTTIFYVSYATGVLAQDNKVWNMTIFVQQTPLSIVNPSYTTNEYIEQLKIMNNKLIDALNAVHSAFSSSVIVAPSGGGTCSITVSQPPNSSISSLQEEQSKLEEKGANYA